MSGWVAPSTDRHPTNWSPCATGRLVRVAVVAGLLTGVALAATNGPQLAAQPARATRPDDQSPLPPEPVAAPPAAAQFQIPDRDTRGIFIAIRDGTPVQPVESDAWAEVILHARNFTATELEQHAAHNLTTDDLLYEQSRKALRLTLMRFEGRLVKVRKVKETRTLAEIRLVPASEAVGRIGFDITPEALADAGLGALYEGWMLPTGEQADTRLLCVVFSDLPPDLPEPGDDGRSVPVDRWVSFAGYLFKIVRYPGPNADPNLPPNDNWRGAPLLIGRSVTPLPGPPTADIRIDPNLKVLEGIKDDAPLVPYGDSLEVAARDRVILHASRFTAAELEAAANPELSYPDLFHPHRLNNRMAIVRFEGRMRMLRAIQPDARLRNAGITTLYQGWLTPKNEPNGNPITFLITELPAGVEPQPADAPPIDRWATVAGYSFKLIQYETSEKRQDDPTRNVWKRAPLLIGRSITLREEPPLPSRWGSEFVPIVTGAILLLVGTALGLSWWFRRGDRAAKQSMEAVRNRNPFDPPAGG